MSIGQFTGLLTVEIFSRGGGQNFSIAENHFLSVLPLGPKISSFYDCIFAFLDWLHHF